MVSEYIKSQQKLSRSNPEDTMAKLILVTGELII
jgi:hypothetical protein